MSHILYRPPGSSSLKNLTCQILPSLLKENDTRQAHTDTHIMLRNVKNDKHAKDQSLWWGGIQRTCLLSRTPEC